MKDAERREGGTRETWQGGEHENRKGRRDITTRLRPEIPRERDTRTRTQRGPNRQL